MKDERASRLLLTCATIGVALAFGVLSLSFMKSPSSTESSLVQGVAFAGMWGFMLVVPVASVGGLILGRRSQRMKRWGVLLLSLWVLGAVGLTFVHL
jgi:hypothetical protein